jgi:hypothetical protein
MTFLVFYDKRGQAQRVATANNEADVARYLDAGFVTVAQSEYNRAASLVPVATVDELPSLIAATALLAQIQTQQRTIAQLDTVNTEALERLQARLKADYQRITSDFQNGTITIDQWYRQMVDLSNRANIAVTALAVGGVRNLTADDLQAIERANETQSSYLNGFRREMGALSTLAAIARAALYAGALSALFWAATSRMLGLPELPAQPGVLTSCTSQCKCHWSIKKLDGDGNWDCRWILAIAEHCPECVARSDAFDPLQIRGGIIQPFNPAGIYTT